MQKNTIVSIIVALVLIAGGFWVYSNTAQSPNNNTGNDDQVQNSTAIEKAEVVARSWVKNESPTYTFDGQDLKLVSSSTIDTSKFEFTYEFESTHGGYGDRSDKMVTQVITPHEIVVTVEDEEVVEVITDGKFDEMEGEMIQSSNNGNSTTTTHSDISLSNVSDGDTIDRVMTIEGEAKGPWYFEADFPVVAKDTSGNTIDTFIATAQSNWMTTNFVPFEVDIDLSGYSGNTAILEFQKDNPSGESQNDDSYSIQVNLN